MSRIAVLALVLAALAGCGDGEGVLSLDDACDLWAAGWCQVDASCGDPCRWDGWREVCLGAYGCHLDVPESWAWECGDAIAAMGCDMSTVPPVCQLYVCS